MNLSPAQIRQTIKQSCLSAAAAAQTGDAFVIQSTLNAIDSQLLALIPDKPTLESVLAEQANDGR